MVKIRGEVRRFDQWEMRDQPSLGGSLEWLDGVQVKYPIPGPPI